MKLIKSDPSLHAYAQLSAISDRRQERDGNDSDHILALDRCDECVGIVGFVGNEVRCTRFCPLCAAHSTAPRNPACANYERVQSLVHPLDQ
jgi:ferredoxin